MTLSLSDVRKLCEEATPGPWQWFGNTNHHEVYLATTDRGRVFVMDFARWGMSSAQPRFQVALNGRDDSGVMRSVGEMAKNEEMSKPAVPFGPLFEAPYRKQFTGIGHPDARFIAASRTLVPQLLALVEEQAKEVERLRAIASQAIELADGYVSHTLPIMRREADERLVSLRAALSPPSEVAGPFDAAEAALPALAGTEGAE